MLGFNEEFLKKINTCAWLKNCGQYNDLTFDFTVKIVKDKKTAVRSIRSLDWGNICLERDGDFSVFLHLNHNKEYNQFWNVVVEKVKESYMEDISTKIVKLLRKLDLPEFVLDDMRANIITQFMLNFYSDFGYEDPFWTQMFEIYMAGYLPCGWSGDAESGEFFIY